MGGQSDYATTDPVNQWFHDFLQQLFVCRMNKVGIKCCLVGEADNQGDIIAAVNDSALAGYGPAASETDYARYGFQCLAGLYDGVLCAGIARLFQPDNDDVFDCFI